MPAPLGILLRLLGASIVMPDPQDYTPPVVNIAYNPIPIGTYYRQVHKSDSLSTLLEWHNRSCVLSILSSDFLNLAVAVRLWPGDVRGPSLDLRSGERGMFRWWGRLNSSSGGVAEAAIGVVVQANNNEISCNGRILIIITITTV